MVNYELEYNSLLFMSPGGFKLQNMKVNGDRLWNSLMEMAKIGATEKGGVCRLALTDEDKTARDLYV